MILWYQKLDDGFEMLILKIIQKKKKKKKKNAIFFNELNVCMFIRSALESFPTISPLLSRFVPSCPITFSLSHPVLTLLTKVSHIVGAIFHLDAFACMLL